MKWIGLTGGIACGKSAVAAHLRAKGWSVVDADVLAHKALSPGTSSYANVASFFGTGVLNGDKTIDRKRLGAIVFSDKDKLLKLEGFIHPWVQEQTRIHREQFEKAGEKMAFYDVPLLYEKNLQSQFDAVIVVACDESIQIQRLKSRNGFSEEEARRRIAAQMPLAEKIQRTPYVIYNNTTLEDLHTQTNKILSDMCQAPFG